MKALNQNTTKGPFKGQKGLHVRLYNKMAKKKRNNKILDYKNNCYSGQWIRLLSNWCSIYSTRLIALISIRCKITDRNKDCLSFSKQQVQSLMHKIKEKQSCAVRKHQGHTSQSCSPQTMYM